MKPRFIIHLLAALAMLPFGLAARARAASSAITYNHDIRPILSHDCFPCHGPDAGKRKAKLRLDVRQVAVDRGAFATGKSGESELVRRIFAAGTEDLMPPLSSNKTLTAAQKELLRRWVANGAVYQDHWAYVKPVRAAIPRNSNPVDWLVRQRLKELQLSPSPEADRRTLARRLYFDLLGIPPEPEDVEAFVHDRRPDAYSRLVETLLASPHYGERMAIGWLDVVRYADTIGYHSDNPRNVWPYRDYVIQSFNENKPFDVFTREQLAGDLLPDSGQEQKVGSAFNRLLLTTEEGGAQPKDYEARMLTDRVRAVGAVWLGQTIGCAQCHDHKFDPMTSRDFYSMGAFFADIKEPIVGKREDGLLLPNASQEPELARREADVKRLEADYAAPHPELRETFARWDREQSENAVQERRWSPLKPSHASSLGGDSLEIKSDRSVLVSGTNRPNTDTYALLFTNLVDTIQGLRIEVLPDESLPAHGPGRAENGNFVLSKIRASIEHTNGAMDEIAFQSARASFEQTQFAEQTAARRWSAASVIDPAATGEFTGWAVLPEVGKRQQLILAGGQTWHLGAGDALKLELQQNHGHGGHTLGRFRISATTNSEAVQGAFSSPPPGDIADVLVIPAEKRNQEQKDKVWERFKKTAPEFERLRTELAAARKGLEEFEAPIPRCLVSMTNESPRTVRILPRGNFLLETGDVVKPALPGFLRSSWKQFDKPRLTRLDLANWLVSPGNPLTARVVMNRLWKQFFGAGIARPLDDLGTQGEPPNNQELLDWLACEFMDSGWDVKHMIRLLVNCRTYKQTSMLSKKARELDPYNHEFSAQGRWRLDAELVRDNALAIAGLLAPEIGGPSVKPYQPAGYWENLNFPTREWQQSSGEDLYRRGLYTWWQRSYLQPSLLAFDAPTREECCAERTRSDIPQQALVLLNDPTYVEASRVFASHILEHGGDTTAARIRWAWEQALDRAPRKDEVAVANRLLTRHLTEFRRDPISAEAFVRVGAAPVPDHCPPAELAAWTSVARVILNLHETISRN